MILHDGYYAVRYKSGCRAISLQTCKDRKKERLHGKRILSFRNRPDAGVHRNQGWTSFAFLTEGNDVQFFKQYFANCTPQQLESMRSAVRAIVANPDEAFAAFKETEIYRGPKRKKNSTRET